MLTTSDTSARATGRDHGSRGILGRLVQGVGSTLLGQVLFAVQSFLFVPLFLRAWGADAYGAWLSLTAMISYLTLLDLGGQNYIGNLLAIDVARGDLDAFRRKLSEGVSVSLFAALAFLVLLVAALFGAPLLWPSLPWGAPGHWDRRMIILCLASSLLVAIPGGVVVTVYRVPGRYARGAMLSNAIRLGELVVGASALVLRVSPVAYAGVLLVCTLARFSFFAVDSYINVLDCRAIAISPRLAWRGRVFLKGASLFWVMSLATALNQQGVVLVLAASRGPLAVALYATHRTAVGLIGYIGMVVQPPLWVEFSHLWAAERLDEMRKMALMAVRGVALLSGVASAAIWYFLPVVYPIWTGRQISFRPGLLALFLLQAVLSSAWSTSSWGLMAANRLRLPAVWSLANACVTMLLAIWWAPRHGIYGVALATLVGDVVCGLAVYPRLAGRFLKAPPGHVEWSIVSSLALLAPLFLGTYAIARWLTPGWGLVAFSALIAAWALPAARLAFGAEGLARIGAFLRGRRGGRGPIEDVGRGG